MPKRPGADRLQHLAYNDDGLDPPRHRSRGRVTRIQLPHYGPYAATVDSVEMNSLASLTVKNAADLP